MALLGVLCSGLLCVMLFLACVCCSVLLSLSVVSVVRCFCCLLHLSAFCWAFVLPLTLPCLLFSWFFLGIWLWPHLEVTSQTGHFQNGMSSWLVTSNHVPKAMCMLIPNDAGTG